MKRFSHTLLKQSCQSFSTRAYALGFFGSKSDTAETIASPPTEFSDLSNFSVSSLERLSSVRMLTHEMRSDPRDKIKLSDYLSMAQRHGIDAEDANNLLHHFHQTGQFYYFDKHDSLSNVVILKPSVIHANALDALSIDLGRAQIDQHREQYDRIMNELRPLMKKKASLDIEAEKSARIWLSAGFGALTCQGAVLAAGTWGEYGWDVIEPVTYFSGFTVVLGSFLYFIATRRDYDYGTVWMQLVTRRRRALYTRHQFDYLRYLSLMNECKELRSHIESICIDQIGQVPDSINRAFSESL